MKKNAKKILLVGGGGFIGHNLALSLKKDGNEVYILDHFKVNNFKSREIKGNAIKMEILEERKKLLKTNKIPIVECDVRKFKELYDAVGDIAPNFIVHLAAISHANKCNLYPMDAFENNFLTLQNSIEVARLGGVKQFIYLSSSMVYGDFPPTGAIENMPCSPKGIYAALKLSGELLVKAYKQVFGLEYTIVRPSALYGERCISRRVTQAFIEDAIEKGEIRINGDGKDKLDFTYIDDFVDGVKKVIGNKQAFSQTFNMTYGKARSISDLVGVLKNYFPDLAIKHFPKDSLMPDRGTLITNLAKKTIKYCPKYPIEKGYRRYIEWSLNKLKK